MSKTSEKNSGYCKTSVFHNNHKIYIDSENNNTIEDHTNSSQEKKNVSKTGQNKKIFLNTSSFYHKADMLNQDLPPVHSKKLSSNNHYYTQRNNSKITIKSLQKQVDDLNLEINKLRNDSNGQNYNILELNFKQKTKELTELKQENNFIRFQLEDLSRKKNLNPINNKSSKAKKRNIMTPVDTKPKIKNSLDENQKVGDYGNIIEKYEREKSSLKKKIEQCVNENKRLMKKIELFDNEKNELKNKYTDLLKSKKKCETELSDLKKDMEEINEENRNYKRHFKDKTNSDSKITDLKTANEKLSKEISEKNKQIEKYISDQKEAKKENDNKISSLNKERSVLNERVNSLQKEYEDYKTKNEKKIKKLSTDVENFQKQIGEISNK